MEEFADTSSETDRQRGTQMTTKEFFNIAVRCVYAPSAKTNKIKQSDRVANSHCVRKCGRRAEQSEREGEEIRLKWGKASGKAERARKQQAERRLAAPLFAQCLPNGNKAQAEVIDSSVCERPCVYVYVCVVYELCKYAIRMQIAEQ